MNVLVKNKTGDWIKKTVRVPLKHTGAYEYFRKYMPSDGSIAIKRDEMGWFVKTKTGKIRVPNELLRVRLCSGEMRLVPPKTTTINERIQTSVKEPDSFKWNANYASRWFMENTPIKSNLSTTVQHSPEKTSSSKSTQSDTLEVSDVFTQYNINGRDASTQSKRKTMMNSGTQSRPSVNDMATQSDEIFDDFQSVEIRNSESSTEFDESATTGPTKLDNSWKTTGVSLYDELREDKYTTGSDIDKALKIARLLILKKERPSSAEYITAINSQGKEYEHYFAEISRFAGRHLKRFRDKPSLVRVLAIQHLIVHRPDLYDGPS